MTSTQAEVVAVGLAAEAALSEPTRVNIKSGDVQGRLSFLQAPRFY